MERREISDFNARDILQRLKGTVPREAVLKLIKAMLQSGELQQVRVNRSGMGCYRVRRAK